jgi:hypothetical protein
MKTDANIICLVMLTVAYPAVAEQTGWVGNKGQDWQFVVGVGMACAVTALPILILLLEKLNILRYAYFKGTIPFLSALYAAGRHEEILTLLEHPYFSDWW